MKVKTTMKRKNLKILGMLLGILSPIAIIIYFQEKDVSDVASLYTGDEETRHFPTTTPEPTPLDLTFQSKPQQKVVPLDSAQPENVKPLQKHSESDEGAKQNRLLNRITPEQGYTALSPESYNVLGDMNPKSLAIAAHISFLNDEADIVNITSTDNYQFRYVLYTVSPYSYEALMLWERDSIGSLLQLSEIAPFLESPEGASLINYSESL